MALPKIRRLIIRTLSLGLVIFLSLCIYTFYLYQHPEFLSRIITSPTCNASSKTIPTLANEKSLKNDESLLSSSRSSKPYGKEDLNDGESSLIKMVHHFKNKPGLVHQVNSSMDACPILVECYPGVESIYANYSTCVENMPLILKYYDSSALVKDGHVIGFISYNVERDHQIPKNRAISIYNVCIDPVVRGRGLAKRMLAEGIEAVISHYSLLPESTLLALDVDLTSQMGAESFSLYAKLGFLRGWQPCRSVGDVDWRPLFTAPTSPAIQSPLSTILVDPVGYQQDILKGKNPTPRLPSRSQSSSGTFNHYCMFRFYQESWLTIGQMLVEPFKVVATIPPSNDTDDGMIRGR